MIKRLKRKYGENQPIFTYEILETMCDYSRPRVFQLLKKAEEEQELIKFAKGVYYIPTQTRYGKSLLSVEQVVKKKYVADKNTVFGIYAGLQLEQSFMLTSQVPSSIEIITNNETTWVREIEISNRNVILRKSRVEITPKNAGTYTILELFTQMDIENYKENSSAQREVLSFIKENDIKVGDIFDLAQFFPAKTTKNIMYSGILNSQILFP